MEDLSSEIHNVLEPTTFFSELNNSNIELLSDNNLNQPLNSHVLDYLSCDTFLTHPNTSQPPQSYTQVSFDQANNVVEFGIQRHGKNVAARPEFAEFSSSSLGPRSEYNGNYTRTDKINGASGRKRKRKNEGNGDKLKEVTHVRAKRGQATDSHSLAERVRRERINEKLKVLQDLVPGCYKTMAMASMFDVIIEYVGSLQNQIEFLSMKLSTASMFYDFNSPEAEAIETLLRTTSPYEVHEMERSAREGHRGTLLRLHSAWPF